MILGMVTNLAAGAALATRSKEARGGERVVNLNIATKTTFVVIKFSTEVDRTRTYNESRGGGNYSSRPPFSCGPVKHVRICATANSQ